LGDGAGDPLPRRGITISGAASPYLKMSFGAKSARGRRQVGRCAGTKGAGNRGWGARVEGREERREKKCPARGIRLEKSGITMRRSVGWGAGGPHLVISALL
jgi:hypothetical protein